MDQLEDERSHSPALSSGDGATGDSSKVSLFIFIFISYLDLEALIVTSN